MRACTFGCKVDDGRDGREITFHQSAFKSQPYSIVHKDEFYLVLTEENYPSAEYFPVFAEALLEAIYDRVLA